MFTDLGTNFLKSPLLLIISLTIDELINEFWGDVKINTVSISPNLLLKWAIFFFKLKICRISQTSYNVF